MIIVYKHLISGHICSRCNGSTRY